MSLFHSDMLLKTELLAFLAVVFGTTSKAQDSSIGCFVAGECAGGLATGLANLDTIGECVDFCNTISSCHYFSYGPNDNVCLALEECPLVSTDNCPACISGDSSCSSKICGVPGEKNKGGP